MEDNPLWIDVTELMQKGAGEAIQRLVATRISDQRHGLHQPSQRDHGIQQTDFHIDEVTGEDKTVDVVVDIFNSVNSGGTKLSKGDLGFARICAEWPDARDEMKADWTSGGRRLPLPPRVAAAEHQHNRDR